MEETSIYNLNNERAAKSCRCCDIRSPFRVLLNGKKSSEEGILRCFKQYTGIEETSQSEYLCRICVKKVLHIKKKITELKLMCQSSRETISAFPCKTMKRGFQETNPILPLAKKKTMVLSQPKGESCFITKFRQIAPKPPTVDLARINSAALPAFTSTAVTVTKQPPTSGPRILPKYLEPEKAEGADVLASFGLHARVNIILMF